MTRLTLVQAMQMAFGSWPAEWEADPMDAIVLLRDEVLRLKGELHQFRDNVLSAIDGKGKEWDQGGDPVVAIRNRIESIPLPAQRHSMERYSGQLAEAADMKAYFDRQAQKPK